MKRFLVGADRGQSTLLPECLDEWIDESNPVRAVDSFVDALDGQAPMMAPSRREYRGICSAESGSTRPPPGHLVGAEASSPVSNHLTGRFCFKLTHGAPTLSCASSVGTLV